MDQPALAAIDRTSRRFVVLLVIAHVIAWIILGLGFVAGLTPSEGQPSIGEILFFAALPIALVALGFLRRSITWQILSGLQLLVMLLCLRWLFVDVLHYWG